MMDNQVPDIDCGGFCDFFDVLWFNIDLNELEVCS